MENSDFYLGWSCNLLNNLKESCNESTCREIMHVCADYHYSHNKMDEILDEYVGNLDKFIEFLTLKWGWIVDYDKENGIIIADENKSKCVCPVVHKLKDRDVSNVICYCSEAFAEKMFSKICKMNVTSRVVKSILSGDKTCVYEILIK